jgi:archaellum component FlaC
LKLLPAMPEQVKDIEKDYDEMQVMLFGDAPKFGDILDELKRLEAEINATGALIR